MRRAQPRHPTALLVDQDRRVGTADGGAQVVNQRSDLGRARAIARKQDEPPGVSSLYQGALGVVERTPGDPDDRSRD
jgi:hypothetical protein